MMTVEGIVRLLRPWQDGYPESGEPTRRQVCKDTCDLNERVLWLAPRPQSLRSPLAFESFALLALLGRIDTAKWKAEIEAIWMSHRQVVERFRAQVVRVASSDSPLIGFNVAIDSSTSSTIGELADRITPYQSVSSEYDENFSDIEYAVARISSPTDVYAVDVRTPVRVLCTSPSIQERTLILRRIFQLACAQDYGITSTLTKTSLTMQRAMFHARPRIVEVCVDGVVDLEGLTHLKNLRELGVQVHKMPQVDVDEHTLATHFMVQLLHELVPQSDSALPGVQRVVVGCRTPDHCLTPVMSALRFSHSVTCVEFECFNCDDDSEQHTQKHQQLWRWVAHALFSRGARHNISKFVLKTRLKSDDVVAFEEALAATNSLDFATNGHPNSQPQGQVHARRFWNQTARAGASPETGLWTSSTTVVADVVECPRDDDPWWIVSLPGYDIAVVHTDEIIRYDPCSSLPSAPKITALEVTTEYESDTLPQLLQSIGRSLESIRFIAGRLQYTRFCFSQAWFTSVFTQCPLLETLIMQRDPRRAHVLNAVVNAILATDCKLRRFESCYAYADARTYPDLDLFLYTLGLGDHPFATRLEHVRMAVCPQNEDALKFLDPVLYMLEDNRQLRRFTLDVRLLPNATNVRDIIDGKLERYLTKPQQEITAALDKRCKLAFLSVVTRLSGGASAVGRLDSVMAGHILAFAGQRFMRTVEITYARYNEDATERQCQYSTAATSAPESGSPALGLLQRGVR